MLFVDASVVVAILAGEPDRESLLDRLEQVGGPYHWSAVVRMEAVLSLARRLAFGSRGDQRVTPEIVAGARTLVDQFGIDLDLSEIMIDGDAGSKALDAAQNFGKIVNHPAQLNMGDCLAYGCADAHQLRIAYKGNDFTATRLGW
ncbi:PIN domain-containing protein [Mesorhizobium sp. NBSH29]|uniref:type II toxin-antitoxin system VapC family toxin n=1 Tax=Mesorhizobium sp. NBSH29 TaxID=2654249 RepID=UPI0018964F5A|nr:type II toxin-antitoxin system VapC family toxin [Mesorhizobium sp. NBSH29]QPC86211.1 PIN domain-containing protein [Mesorhizobium sp. NBSH29]